MAFEHPISGEGVSTDYLNKLFAAVGSHARVTDAVVTGDKSYGQEMVSTAARTFIEVKYAPGAPADLPTRLVLKLARGVDDIMGPFYRNEVEFYTHIRPDLSIEAPRSLGGHFDVKSKRFSLILEDLRERRARFPNVLDSVTLDEVRCLLQTLANLHARYWNSPRFRDDLRWVETHLTGGVADLMNNLAPSYIQHEIDTQKFKAEFVGSIGATGATLLAGVQALQRHQARLPQTLLHGDTHLGNTYLLPNARGGLLDWQLMVRGHHMHDVSYLITTALTIADRRSHERDLLAFYLDQLAAAGASGVANFETTWREYRRALVWGVYIGWLTTPVVNYGWEINVVNHLRLITAYVDHETAKLVKEIQ